MNELVITIAFLIFIGYREWLINKHVRDLELKLLAKSPQEYATLKAIEEPAKPQKQKEEDDLVEPEEVDAQDAIRGIGGVK